MGSNLIETHSVPLFEGAGSRRHQDVAVWRLLLQARRRRLAGPSLKGLRSFVQFVGFPRSGHSLIGSLIDAHPEAMIAHELDAMGLLAKGMSAADIRALAVHNSLEFSRHGRYWNGFSYAVNGCSAGGGRIRVLGDKKGDWVARHHAADPSLLDEARRRFRVRCQWILVVRDPYDNIATMSLRKGGVYDRLRVENPDSGAFRAALKERQAAGDVAAAVLDSMIDDYFGLCRSVEAMKRRLAPTDWHEVDYEAFTAAPYEGLRALFGFLELSATEAFLTDATAIVRRSGRRSRDDLAWQPGQLARVEAMIEEFSFLGKARGHD
jgi:hypothetical protein